MPLSPSRIPQPDWFVLNKETSLISRFITDQHVARRKVIFLLLSVILFRGGGEGVSLPWTIDCWPTFPSRTQNCWPALPWVPKTVEPSFSSLWPKNCRSAPNQELLASLGPRTASLPWTNNCWYCKLFWKQELLTHSFPDEELLVHSSPGAKNCLSATLWDQELLTHPSHRSKQVDQPSLWTKNCSTPWTKNVDLPPLQRHERQGDPPKLGLV